MSYSQYAEDLKVQELLKKRGIETGHLLEIGAWNPVTLSNSRLLIEAGWSAFLVEPSPKPLADLVKFYADNPNVTVFGFPITVGGGSIAMALTDDALSGEAIQEAWREKGGYYGFATMMSMSMRDFLQQYGGDFEFVSIDVEGASVDLFSELVVAGARPKVVIVEHDNRIVELSGIAEAANYRQAHINGTNVILEWTSGL